MYQPGENFTGRYELIDHLGTGGFGEVWKAYDHTIEEHVALKIVGGGSQISRDLVKACSDEYKAMLKIHHTHLLTPQYFDIYQGKMYLVMRLCEGGSLASHLLRNTLAEEEVHRLIQELGSALAHLHRSGLLHNDIKPDNILLEKPLSEGGSFLLTDFGISPRLRSSIRKSTGADKDKKGMTHAYSAPELFGSQPKQTPATDIFSFGVMLYECCAGDVPWMGAGGVMLNTVAVVPELPYTYSPALGRLVSSCMSLDPAQRPDAGALSGFAVKAEPPPEKRSTQQQERKTVKREEDTPFSPASQPKASREKASWWIPVVWIVASLLFVALTDYPYDKSGKLSIFNILGLIMPLLTAVVILWKRKNYLKGAEIPLWWIGMSGIFLTNCITLFEKTDAFFGSITPLSVAVVILWKRKNYLKGTEIPLWWWGVSDGFVLLCVALSGETGAFFGLIVSLLAAAYIFVHRRGKVKSNEGILWAVVIVLVVLNALLLSIID